MIRTDERTSSAGRPHNGAHNGPHNGTSAGASKPAAEREPSLGQLLKDLASQSGLLVKQEVELAKSEVSEKVKVVGRNLAYLAIGGLVAFAAFLTLLGAASYGLMEALDDVVSPSVAVWLAPLIVGVVVAIVAAVLLTKAIAALRAESLAPRRTIETLKEDKQWLQNRMK